MAKHAPKKTSTTKPEEKARSGVSPPEMNLEAREAEACLLASYQVLPKDHPLSIELNKVMGDVRRASNQVFRFLGVNLSPECEIIVLMSDRPEAFVLPGIESRVYLTTGCIDRIKEDRALVPVLATHENGHHVDHAQRKQNTPSPVRSRNGEDIWRDPWVKEIADRKQTGTVSNSQDEERRCDTQHSTTVLTALGQDPRGIGRLLDKLRGGNNDLQGTVEATPVGVDDQISGLFRSHPPDAVRREQAKRYADVLGIPDREAEKIPLGEIDLPEKRLPELGPERLAEIIVEELGVLDQMALTEYDAFVFGSEIAPQHYSANQAFIVLNCIRYACGYDPLVEFFFGNPFQNETLPLDDEDKKQIQRIRQLARNKIQGISLVTKDKPEENRKERKLLAQRRSREIESVVNLFPRLSPLQQILFLQDYKSEDGLALIKLCSDRDSLLSPIAYNGLCPPDCRALAEIVVGKLVFRTFEFFAHYDSKDALNNN